jgi:hypothetical protein
MQDNPEWIAEASPNKKRLYPKKQITPQSKAKKGTPLREYTLRITRPASDEDGDGEYMLWSVASFEDAAEVEN